MNAIPHAPTAIVGRERELAEIGALLTGGDARFVTLTGPGGIGKTRLALAVAEASAGHFADAAFVSLAPIRDPGLVLPAIAQALAVPAQPGVAPLELLIGAIGGRTSLLVLDNFEQVRAAGADVAQLLEACAGLAVLVTSRARLNLRGEHEVAMQPLPLPETAADDELASNPAVALFLDRAREVRPDLALTPATAPAIAEICRRLDGLPLAIELAAARSKVLPPGALLARLERRLPVLTGGANDLPQRQRTMRNAVAWSYDLLAEEERAVFRRASVFSGGFTLHEAEAVLGDGSWVAGRGDAGAPSDGQASGSSPAPIPHDPSLVLDVLSSLVDSSLILQTEREAEPRFVLLETLREFGLEQLAAHGEFEAMRERHAEFFLGFAEAASGHLKGAERTSWLDRLTRAHDNIRAALTWVTERQDTARAVGFGGALWQFWWWRSYVAEGRQRLERVLALPGAEELGVASARLLTGCGALAETQGDYAAAEAYHERAVAAWERLDDARGLATTLLFRWLVAFNADDQERMSALSSASYRLFSDAGDPWGVAMSLMQQGVQAMRRSDHAAAEDVLARGIAVFQQIGDGWGVAICQGVLGNVATDRGDAVTAARLLEESLTTLLLLNDLWGVATVMPAVARLAAEQGAVEHAVRVSGAILQMHLTMGAPLKVPFRERYERNLEAAREKLGTKRFEALLAEGQALSPTEAVRLAITPIAHFAPERNATTSRGAASLALPLSPREREVLRLIPQKTARQIGEALYISESTVRTHIENILNKLGLSNQKELIAYGYEHGLF